ncbi:MAG: roadblock/LC7 domain-containing protein [Pseudomonadota bacterium]|nr:roadblock/LC7 domain-containing protein [Pseudomonadota bacterium]
MPTETEIEPRRWAKFLPEHAQAQCLDNMQQTLAGISGAYCLILSSLDGMQIAKVARKDCNASRLAAITSSLCGLGETLAKELGQAEFKDVLISTSSGIAVVQRVPPPGHRLVLLVAANHESNVGIVSSQTRWCAQTLAQHAFT